MATSAQQAKWGVNTSYGGAKKPSYAGTGSINPPVPGKLVEYPSGKVVNPVSKHPVVLLNELIPNLQYSQQQYGSRYCYRTFLRAVVTHFAPNCGFTVVYLWDYSVSWPLQTGF